MISLTLFATRWSSGVEQWVPDARQVCVPSIAVERSLSLLADADRFPNPPSIPVGLSSDNFGIVPINQVIHLGSMVGESGLMESALRGFTLGSGVRRLRSFIHV